MSRSAHLSWFFRPGFTDRSHSVRKVAGLELALVTVHPTTLYLRRPAGRGFTLLELLVVMVIIGLLAAYVGPKLFGQIGKSETKVARAQMAALQTALDQYRIDTGRYPATEQGLQALNARPGDEPKWAGPYLNKGVPKDPWGRDYVYRSPGEHGDFDIVSWGRDGRAGGTGEDGDVTSW